MGLWDRVSDWLEPPSLDLYQCTHCDARYDEAFSACPDCDGELQPDGTLAYYWEPM